MKKTTEFWIVIVFRLCLWLIEIMTVQTVFQRKKKIFKKKYVNFHFENGRKKTMKLQMYIWKECSITHCYYSQTKHHQMTDLRCIDPNEITLNYCLFPVRNSIQFNRYLRWRCTFVVQPMIRLFANQNPSHSRQPFRIKLTTAVSM